MNIWHSLEGQIEVTLLTADPAAAIDAIAKADIPVMRIHPVDELTVSVRIRRSHFLELMRLSQRRGESITIQKKSGLYYIIQRLLRRRVLLMGITIIFAFTLFLPTRILFFQVSGNEQVETERIIEAAEKQGLRFGISRRNIRSEKIKNGLLAAIPELKWAGVNTYGCVAQITVAEKQGEQPPAKALPGVGHLVSCMDGIVSNVTVTRGTALCRPGQAVVKGQTLVSGLVDCGIVQKGTAAQGTVTAVTTRSLSVSTPEKQVVRMSRQKSRTGWSLLIGKKRIKIWNDSRIWDARCGRIYEEYPLTLPGGFRLPIRLASEKSIQGAVQEEGLSAAEAQTQLSSAADTYLRQRMLAGVIQQKQENLSEADGQFALAGNYLCREVISRRQWEQIGDIHE